MNRIERALEWRTDRRRNRSLCDLDLFPSAPAAPQPDPAIGQAAAANAEVAKDALAFNKQQYEDMKPRIAEYDQFMRDIAKTQIDTQNKANAQSDDYLNYMKTVFRPLEQKLAQDATDFNTDARRNELATQAGADVEQQAGLVDAQARRDAARYGVNPSDGAFSEGLASSNLNRTAMKVGAMNSARTQARAEGRAFQMDVAGLGRNLPGAGATSSQLAIQAGNSAGQNAGAPLAAENTQTQLMNSGYGTAVGANQSAGNLYSGLYQGQLGAWSAQTQANNQAMAGLGQGLGTLAGVGIMKYSSEDLKEDKTAVSDEAVLEGLKRMPSVESWKYKDGVEDSGEHIGPYAQDVNKQFGDQAAPGGQMIDLVSMNGLAIAGVKALAKKVERLEKAEASGLTPKMARNKARNTEPTRRSA